MTGALYWDSISKNSQTLKNFTTFNFQRMNQASSTAESFCHLWKSFFFTKEWRCYPSRFSASTKDQPRRFKRGTSKLLVSQKSGSFVSLERRLSCTSSMISDLYQLFDISVDVTFHDSIAQCKRIRIITAVIEYIHRSYSLR